VTSTWLSRRLNLSSNAILTKLVIVNERCGTQNDEFLSAGQTGQAKRDSWSARVPGSTSRENVSFMQFSKFIQHTYMLISIR
jgi:hypothetical protein